MSNVQADLLALKDQALNATKAKDANFYRHYLADNAVAIVPFGVFDKEAIVKMMAGDSPFKSVAIEDTRATVLNDDSGIVTYKAVFESKSGDGKRSTMYVTTVYARIDGEWKGVFYQQTPLQ